MYIPCAKLVQLKKKTEHTVLYPCNRNLHNRFQAFCALNTLR